MSSLSYLLNSTLKYSLLILLVAIGLIAGMTSLYLITEGLHTVNDWYGDSLLISTLLSAIVTGTFLILANLQSKRTAPDTSNTPEKLALYKRLITDITKLMLKDPTVTTADFKHLIDEYSIDILAVGSESVLNHFYYIDDKMKKDANIQTLLRYSEQLLHAVRKDLGLKTHEEEGRILSLFQKATAKEIRKQYRS